MSSRLVLRRGLPLQTKNITDHYRKTSYVHFMTLLTSNAIARQRSAASLARTKKNYDNIFILFIESYRSNVLNTEKTKIMMKNGKDLISLHFVSNIINVFISIIHMETIYLNFRVKIKVTREFSFS